MSDKQREEFEKWLKPWGWGTDIDSEGYYEETVVQMAWNAWQAREPKVVKLPPRLRGIDENCRINNRAVDMIQRLLTEAGIRYE